MESKSRTGSLLSKKVLTGFSITLLIVLSVYIYQKSGNRPRGMILVKKTPRLEIMKYARTSRSGNTSSGLIGTITGPNRYIIHQAFYDEQKKRDKNISEKGNIANEKSSAGKDRTEPTLKKKTSDDEAAQLFGAILGLGLGLAIASDYIDVFGFKPGFGLHAEGYFSGDGRIGALVRYDCGDNWGYIDINEFKKFVNDCKAVSAMGGIQQQNNTQITVSVLDTDRDEVRFQYDIRSRKWSYKGYNLVSVLPVLKEVDNDLLSILQDLEKRSN